MIITDEIVTDEGTFKTNGRPLGKLEDVRNYIETHPERYAYAENNSVDEAIKLQIELDKIIPDPIEYFGEEFVSSIIEEDNNDFRTILTTVLMADNNVELQWIGFRMAYLGKPCIWDKETGSMYIIV